MIKKMSEKRVSSGVRILGYGVTGVGKTRLIDTLENPIVLNIEDKLTVDRDDIAVIDVGNGNEAKQAIDFICTSDQAKDYTDIVIDSGSDLSDIIYSDCFEKHNGNSFKVSPEAYSTMIQIMKRLKSLRDKNLYMIAKRNESMDEDGVQSYTPMFANARMQIAIPYMFDVVMAVRKKVFEGEEHVVLQCQRDGKWLASDANGVLGKWEPADLSKIIEKIKNKNNA